MKKLSALFTTEANTIPPKKRSIKGTKIWSMPISSKKRRKTRKLHDEALENFLKRLAHPNLNAKPEKCKFLQKEIQFYGLIFTENTTHPYSGRIENLVKASSAKNAGEVRSFLGLANTYHNYAPDYAVITALLRELVKKSHTFDWNNTHQRAFEQIK